MVANFWNDLAQARKSEDLVREVFASLTNEYTFIDVGSQREYFKKGDIKAIDKDGNEIMIEVKCDSRIAETRNVLCEEENYYYQTGEWIKGNFYNDYQIYCVVSESERKIYVMDFSILKANYKKGQYKCIHHYDQDCYCYLLPLGFIKKQGGIIAEVEY